MVAQGKRRVGRCVQPENDDELHAFSIFSRIFIAPLSHQQPALPSDTAGSLWWHRNFAEGDDAIFNAQWEVIEYVLFWVVQCACGRLLVPITR